MSEQSWRDCISTTSWRSAGACESRIFDLLEDQLLSIVEASGINGLSEKFARWLRSVGVKLRHVDVVDEEDHFLAAWWTEQSLSLGFEVAFESILEVLRVGLAREVDHGADNMLWCFHQEIFDDDGFTNTCLARDQNVATAVE